MVILTDKYLSGMTVINLKKKTFIIDDSGHFEAMKQADESVQEKFILSVKLTDDSVMDWIPNETSKKILRKQLGNDTENWIGKGGEFITVKQNVRGEMRDVVYVKENE